MQGDLWRYWEISWWSVGGVSVGHTLTLILTLTLALTLTLTAQHVELAAAPLRARVRSKAHHHLRVGGDRREVARVAGHGEPREDGAGELRVDDLVRVRVDAGPNPNRNPDPDPNPNPNPR